MVPCECEPSDGAGLCSFCNCCLALQGRRTTRSGVGDRPPDKPSAFPLVIQPRRLERINEPAADGETPL
jgi:hypothetical protein